MNVLYFDPKFATLRRNAPTRAYSFARYLVEQGDRVTVVGLDRRSTEPGRASPPRGRLVDRETVDGIDVIWVGIPYAQRFSKWKRLLSYGGYTLAATLAAARVPKPDVVLASSTPLTVGLNGLAYARARRIPFVFEIQDVWPDVPIELGFLTNRVEIAAAEWLERTLYRAAERVVVCSESAGELLERKGVPAEKIVLVPNLAETELFGSAEPNPGYFEELGLDGRFVALYTGAMGKANGLDQLVDAARTLHERGNERIGIVALGNGSERPWLEQQAAGLPNLFVPPPVARDELARIVRAAGATITLYAPYKILETGSPNKLFDSLAAGKPFVVNTDGWLRRVAEENRAGLYVPASDGPALADALVSLAEDPELAAELGRNGRALAEREFARDLLAERLRQTLRAVVSRTDLSRPVVILGLQPAGLALARSLGRRGIRVIGVALERADFGLRSRYLAARHLVLDPEPDSPVLEIVRAAAADGPVVLVPERDAHVDLVLRNWDELRGLAAIPLPDDRAATDALRDKDGLAEVAARAGLATPRTMPLPSEEALREVDLAKPFLLKPLESERYALAFSHKVVVVDDSDDGLEAWRHAREAGFELFAQELVPDSTDRILSLFTYIGRDGEPLGSVVGRKVRQGPPRFGASTVFAVEPDEEVLEAGLELLSSVGYRGFAHVELVRDLRDRTLKVLEVNTRLPVWAGAGMSRRYDLAPLAYADLCGESPVPLPPFAERVSWVYLAKDAVTAARLARQGELDPVGLVRPYLGPHVPAVFARDDPAPAAEIVRWLAARGLEKARRKSP